MKGLQGIDGAAKKAQGSINGAANNIRGFGAAAQATGASVNDLGSKFASLAAQLGLTVSAIALVKSSLDATFGRDVAETRLRNLTGSAQEYELALKMAAVASQRFGITQTEATKALGDVYGRLQGVGYGLKEINQIYTGFNVIAKQAGMAAEDASGTFFQLSQALGKGKLNGDEFVIIAERMPQLLDAIAQTTGRSRGELTQMAQEGKITGDVLYKALAGSVAGANNLNGALTKQQTTMADVARYADEMRVQLGAALAPAFLSIMEKMGAAALLLSKGFQAVATWAKQNETMIVAIVNALLKFGAAVAIVFAVVKAFQALQKAIAAAAAAKAFLVGLTGKGLLLVAAAAGGAALAYKGLSDTIDGVGKEVGKLQKQASAEMAGMTAEVQKQQDAYSSLPQPIDDAKEAAKELKEEQEAVTKAIQEAIAAADKQAQAQTAAVDGMLQVTQARLQAEQAVNQVLLEQAQRQLDGAKTQADRVKAAQDVYNLTVRQAELEYQATSAAIEAEARKSDIALQNAQLKAKEVEAVVRLAQAQGVVTDAHWKALEAQYQAVQLAERAQEVAWKVAAAQEAAAQATYEGKVNAAKAAYEQNIVAKNTQAAATAAGGFASNMERAAQAAKETAAAVQKAATAIGTTSTGTGAVTTELNGDIPPELQAQIKKAQQEIWDRAANSGSAMAILEAFNKGQAVAVEMVNEYQKNAGKLEQFNGTMDLLDKAAQAFSKGMGDAGRYFENLARQGLSRQDWEVAQREYANRPGAANLGGAISHYSQPVATPRSVDPQVNITTGPVTQVDGTNFVTQADLMSATQSAAKQGAAMAISNLARDPAARRMAGLVR